MAFIFPYIGNNHPNWLVFFRGIETTNQSCSWLGYTTIMVFDISVVRDGVRNVGATAVPAASESLCRSRFLFVAKIIGYINGLLYQYSHKIWPCMVQYLHFRILEFPLICGFVWKDRVPFKDKSLVFTQEMCINLSFWRYTTFSDFQTNQLMNIGHSSHFTQESGKGESESTATRAKQEEFFILSLSVVFPWGWPSIPSIHRDLLDS